MCAVASNLAAAADEDAEDVGDECHDAVPVSLISLLFLFFFSLSLSFFHHQIMFIYFYLFSPHRSLSTCNLMCCVVFL